MITMATIIWNPTQRLLRKIQKEMSSSSIMIRMFILAAIPLHSIWIIGGMSLTGITGIIAGGDIIIIGTPGMASMCIQAIRFIGPQFPTMVAGHITTTIIPLMDMAAVAMAVAVIRINNVILIKEEWQPESRFASA
ncbi:hypothetical protein A2V82_14500 [candidate division KSB1 bacterium RBG_16_48_16]|nr:MAG: hypothetical protein A2V82_14500 [candidate division KSB1 bacterium RBG_16_48_16]